MAQKIKIMHVINNLGIGGAERVLLVLLEELSKNPDVDITLVSLEGHGELTDSFKDLPITLKQFKYHLFVPILRRLEPYFRFRLFLYAMKINPDIVHGHLIKGEDFAKVIGGLLRKPVYTTVHDCHIKPGKKQKWLNRFLTKAIAVSEEVGSHLLKAYELPLGKIVIIPNGIKLDDYKDCAHAFNPRKPVFMYLGRLIESKGVQCAIEGLNSLRKELPGIKFLIFGDGPYRQYLVGLANKNGASFVEFRGAVSDVPGALKEGDIFVLPSKSEGFSMATLEAAAAGKPLLASRTGAIPDMLIEGQNGYFVNYNNPRSIFNGSKKLLGQNIGDFSSSGVGLVEGKFSIGKVSEMYYNLYSKQEL